MRPEVGTTFGGRYRLVSQIAVGGMGEVWVAHDEALARDIAIKVLREEFAGDPGFLERFRAEARNAASLSHPNIAQLYDYGEQDGSAFLVMELVVGEPMSDLLEREPILPLPRLLPILAQTARALHAAHLAGVVHRDVKPGNILLGRGGRVKITDFGVSLANNQVPMTATGMVMGTAQYLSPEQAIGRAATPASDLYSLGIVAYECLVGHRPFTGPTAVDIAVAHVNGVVPPLPPSVEPELAALVMRLLAKEPTERPGSAQQLARTLDAMLGHTPPSGSHAVDPRIVTGSGGAEPVATARPAPPSYPPRRELRDSAGQPTVPGGGSGHRSTGSHRSGPVPRAHDRRRGRVAWPLLVLVLLALALLGAALANRLGLATSSGSVPPVTAQGWISPSYPHPGPNDGMISEHMPTDLTVEVPTTTAKDA
ncbi:serine/threonine-protein kinase [Cellulomonas hominis]